MQRLKYAPKATRKKTVLVFSLEVEQNYAVVK